jgi:hypothetical protein
MNKPKTIRGFDSVAMKHKAQEEIYQDTKHLTPEGKIAYFRREAFKGRLGEFWKKLEKHQSHHKAKVAA